MPSTPNPDQHSASAANFCLDAQALARLQELDPNGANKLMERVITAYVKSLERLLPELESARGDKLDPNVVRHVCHTLKSSSASLGALDLAERCAEIETLARIGQTDGLEPLLDGMLAQVIQVRQALLSLLPNIP
ncbi:Hpt domain-containing protein [Paucibacter sp. TC2R-5]|uniref:Hpt domain-containing protein n=1 Tax=Paucibacter sp. TC2R-5 TaxID=2893555 RepID=UPI0021E3C19A|nr:Hpt domain-containing protein [Paucibacter sp. TC2R-5]MCV2359227.1 Hpt domain-containing protein [Paucibacter sp. TC2R-5]